MFDSLAGRLNAVFDKLTKRGALSEGDVDSALREVRVALLEADVALPVARDFIAKVRERAVGQEVIKSVTPGQMVVKIVTTPWWRHWGQRNPNSTLPPSHPCRS